MGRCKKFAYFRKNYPPIYIFIKFENGWEKGEGWIVISKRIIYFLVWGGRNVKNGCGRGLTISKKFLYALEKLMRVYVS